MQEQNGLPASRHKRWATGLTLAMFVAGILPATLQAGPTFTAAKREKQTMATAEDKFYCKVNALNPAERAHHKQLTDKIIATRKEIVETEKGYEFQFSPADISLAELADWVVAESKCCPFFDFHLDLEQVGTLLCLRLTGEEGIKAFVRTEFRLPGNS